MAKNETKLKLATGLQWMLRRQRMDSQTKMRVSDMLAKCMAHYRGVKVTQLTIRMYEWTYRNRNEDEQDVDIFGGESAVSIDAVTTEGVDLTGRSYYGHYTSPRRRSISDRSLGPMPTDEGPHPCPPPRSKRRPVILCSSTHSRCGRRASRNTLA